MAYKKSKSFIFVLKQLLRRKKYNLSAAVRAAECCERTAYKYIGKDKRFLKEFLAHNPRAKSLRKAKSGRVK